MTVKQWEENQWFKGIWPCHPAAFLKKNKGKDDVVKMAVVCIWRFKMMLILDMNPASSFDRNDMT